MDSLGSIFLGVIAIFCSGEGLIFEYFHLNIFYLFKWMEINESGEQSKESETMIKTNDEGEGPVIRTYVLVKI